MTNKESKENTDKEYVCVRVQIVLVKKFRIITKEKTLGFTTYIPNTDLEAVNMFKKIQKMLERKGVKLDV